MDSARILAKVPLIVENTQFAKLLNTDRFASARLATKDPDLVMDVSKLDAKLIPTAPGKFFFFLLQKLPEFAAFLRKLLLQ